MILALLVVLQAGSVCVTSTNVCAPAGSTMSGQIGQSGGQVTITPSKPMRALGAEFRAGTPVVVTVNPWGGSSRGAVVHVGGELTKETTITGVRVVGTVRIGQLQGTLTGLPLTPQLVDATDIKGGALQVGTSTVDVGPGMRMIGSVDIAGVIRDITSTQPMRALGFELAAGTVRVELRSNGTLIGGTFAKPQQVGGALVDKAVWVTLGGKVPVFREATLARTTPLRLLGLPDGEAPAGTVVRSMPASTLLFGPGPITICGIALVPGAAQPPALNIATYDKDVTINGVLAARDTDVGDGLRMTGPITLRYTAGTCDRRGIDGTLSRPTVKRGLHFASGKQYLDGVAANGADPYVRGTLAKPAIVDGLTLTGAVMVSAPNATDLHLMDGTLAKPATFEAWKLPAKSFVQRFGSGWTFRVPKGQSATAVADYFGERINGVTEAYSDASHTSFTLRRPYTPRGTKLALASVGIDKHTGCVLGNLGTAQQFGIFKIPKNGAATLCGGTLTRAEGTYAVPDLQVGTWWATTAVAGSPNAPPLEAQTNDDLDRGHVAKTSPPKRPTSPPPPPPTAQNASKLVTGYWIQINSLCQAPAGIPLPPPPQRWIWVDLKSVAATTADTKELSTKASKRGTPCPNYPCCPP